jgi:hypothetical protein
MPKRRGRPRKAGPRTKADRLSRAYKSPELRDKGTFECQRKREYLINGADPQLAATASGILLANGLIDERQHIAALRYARAHALTFGKVWNITIPIARELAHHGSEPDELTVEFAQKQLDQWNRRLDPAQRMAVANLAVFGFVPQFFYTGKLKLRPLPSDEAEREALLSELTALA